MSFLEQMFGPKFTRSDLFPRQCLDYKRWQRPLEYKSLGHLYCEKNCRLKACVITEKKDDSLSLSSSERHQETICSSPISNNKASLFRTSNITSSLAFPLANEPDLFFTSLSMETVLI